MTRYLRELFSTENLKTGTKRYYMMVCDAPRRISKADYNEYTDSCDGIDSMSTKSTKTHRRQYKTCSYYM